MSENKKRINVYIPKEMYIKIDKSEYSLTDAIIKGLDLLFTSSKEYDENENNQDILQLQARIKDLQNDNGTLIKELEELKNKEPENNNILQLQKSKITELQDQIKVKDDQIKVNDGNQNNRIGDLKNNIYLLDNQLRTKDDQIEKLNENIHKQAVHIQTLIQENSKLNNKLLPENTKTKKSFWKSLKFW